MDLLVPAHGEAESPAQQATPRVAVVIPCYQDGRLIIDALASLGTQEPCEVVVVDDGSTEAETLRVLTELETAGVRVLHQENRGPSAARNAGVAATAARYVFPLDADDMVHGGALTALADQLDRDEGLSVVWGTATRFGADAPESPVALRVRELDPWRITYLNELPGASLVRRSALLRVGGWRDGTGYEDWDLWLAMAEQGMRGRGLDVPVQRYRVHPSRRWALAHAVHEQVVEELRRAHAPLYRRRSANWRRSPAPWTARLALPLCDALPVSHRSTWRLAHVLLHPKLAMADLRRRRA